MEHPSGIPRKIVEFEYEVLLVSDALSGDAHGLHEATLATFYRIVGDVRPSAEIAGLLAAGQQVAACVTHSPRNHS